MVTSKEISNCLGDHPRRNTLIYESTYQVYIYWLLGEILVDIKMHVFAIRRYLPGPGVCLCIWISAMMHHVHTGEAVVTRPKIDIFWTCHHEAYSALRTIRMFTKLCW